MSKNKPEQSPEDTPKTLEGSDKTPKDTETQAPESVPENPKATNKQANLTGQANLTPKAVFVRLRDLHPQDSYGRAGYRFNKTDEIEIPMSDLTDAQVLELNDDPWLECHFAV